MCSDTLVTDWLQSLCVVVFKEPVPSNYFDDGSWNLEFDEVPMQFQCLMNYVITLPEFQLV